MEGVVWEDASAGDAAVVVVEREDETEGVDDDEETCGLFPGGSGLGERADGTCSRQIFFRQTMEVEEIVGGGGGAEASKLGAASSVVSPFPSLLFHSPTEFLSPTTSACCKVQVGGPSTLRMVSGTNQKEGKMESSNTNVNAWVGERRRCTHVDCGFGGWLAQFPHGATRHHTRCWGHFLWGVGQLGKSGNCSRGLPPNSEDLQDSCAVQYGHY